MLASHHVYLTSLRFYLILNSCEDEKKPALSEYDDEPKEYKNGGEVLTLLPASCLRLTCFMPAPYLHRVRTVLCT